MTRRYDAGPAAEPGQRHQAPAAANARAFRFSTVTAGGGDVARQKALGERVAMLDSSAAHYCLFWMIFGAGTDLDAVESALDATGRWQAELKAAASGER